MRISFEWLTDFVDLTGVTPEQAADLLTMSGTKIEAVEVTDLSQILVGRVISQTPHPTSNKPLWIHQVDVGDRIVQIIAGADNARPGTLAPVALPGTTVPNGRRVRDARIAGVEGRGMLCSALELNLGDDHDGIMLLDRGRPGQPLSELIPSDAVLVAEITSNRADCLGHLGIARELAACLDRPLKVDFMPRFTGGVEPAGSDLLRVAIEDAWLCRRFIAAVLSEVHTGPAPQWMQRRLRAAGLRPINNVVDVTNYVALEYGQPMHAYDLDRLAGPELVARRARAGERVLLLDGVERELTEETLVIADAAGPVGIAGVMGGLNTAVTASTTRVVLEAATFDAASIRATARRYGLRTEASSRFDKGLPPELAQAAMRRAVNLLASVAAAKVHIRWPDVYPGIQEQPPVTLDPGLAERILGIHVPLEEAEAILKRLGCQVAHEPDRTWQVLPPVFRTDLRIPEDLVEEIGRIYGIDRVPATLPGARRPVPEPAPAAYELRDRIRTVLLGAGLNEAVTPAIVSARRQQQLGLAATQLVIANPLSDEMNAMRLSLVPSLVQVLTHNRDSSGRVGAGFFEIARIYLGRPSKPEAELERPDEPLMLTAVAPAGETADEGVAGFRRMRGILDEVVRRLGAPELVYDPTRHPLFHPGRCAAVGWGPRRVGMIGELHPRVAGLLDWSGRLVAMEIDYQQMVSLSRVKTAVPAPRYPAVERDLAVVVDDRVPTVDVKRAIATAGKPLVESVRPFDEYRGAGVPAGRRSLAFALSFRSPERTLTDAEVDRLMEAVRQRLARDFGAEIRGLEVPGG